MGVFESWRKCHRGQRTCFRISSLPRFIRLESKHLNLLGHLTTVNIDHFFQSLWETSTWLKSPHFDLMKAWPLPHQTFTRRCMPLRTCAWQNMKQVLTFTMDILRTGPHHTSLGTGRCAMLSPYNLKALQSLFIDGWTWDDKSGQSHTAQTNV